MMYHYHAIKISFSFAAPIRWPFSGMDALPLPPAHGQLAEPFVAVQQAMKRRGEATDGRIRGGDGDDHPSHFFASSSPGNNTASHCHERIAMAAIFPNRFLNIIINNITSGYGNICISLYVLLIIINRSRRCSKETLFKLDGCFGSLNRNPAMVAYLRPFFNKLHGKQCISTIF